MKISSGIDIVQISRIEKIMKKSTYKTFLSKVFSSEEIDHIKDNSQRIAGYFAVKEAVLKALGHGIDKIPLKDIEIFKKNNKPFVKLNGIAYNILKEMKASDVSISISHEEEYAVSVAMIISED